MDKNLKDQNQILTDTTDKSRDQNSGSSGNPESGASGSPESGSSGNSRSGTSGGLTAVVGILLAIAVIGLFFGCSRWTSSTDTNATRFTTGLPTRGTCLYPDCSLLTIAGSFYCGSHTCHKPNCYNRVVTGSNYCSEHQPETTSARNNNSSAPGRKPAGQKSDSAQKNDQTRKSDPYDIYSYSDVEDFYEDWFDAFDSFDDAEMYWDDHH